MTTLTSRVSVVNRAWEGETAVVIGGGPSLTRDQVDACRGVRAIAVNDAYLWAPWADACYFADSKWWGWQMNGREGVGYPKLGLTANEVVRRWAEFPGTKISISNSAKAIRDPEVVILRNAADHGMPGPLSSDPGFIYTGHNSGYQALNIAVLSGASVIILIGVDGKKAKDVKHWFGEHPDMSAPPFDLMIGSFRLAAAECARLGVTVVNCSPDSAVGAFPKMGLEEALALKPGPVVVRAEPPRRDLTVESVYVRLSNFLKERDAATSLEIAREFPNGLDAALKKGLAKGTIIKTGDNWKHATRLVVDQDATVLPG